MSTRGSAPDSGMPPDRNHQEQQVEIGALRMQADAMTVAAEVQGGLVRFGREAELLSRERVASKQTVAAAREPLTRAAIAAAPLTRCSDPAVVTTTGHLLNGLSMVEDTVRLEVALDAFGRAVNAATAPRRSWWARRRLHTQPEVGVSRV
ncbi:hypothetical protein [Streptomyces virginiae]|uniref:hypothetical protein n=1 Tax=Streptomyces virginiae TaxID=1961 RepID=UPI000526E039|nr:hypothetical protein [Streptomyces virginiae]